MDKVEKMMWAYLLKHGEVTTGWSYYSGYYSGLDYSGDCREKIKSVGIDWDRTSTVKDDYRGKFAGTFADDDGVAVIEGTLVLKDGSRYEWGAEFDNPRSAFRMAAELATMDISDIE